MWLKDANCAKTIGYNPDSSPNGQMSWLNALDFVSGINDETYPLCGAGYTDWRLPNVRELDSLIDCGQYNPALPSGNPFANLQSYYYWSSTTYESSTGVAWGVRMGDGYVYSLGKTITPYVWPVRGGQ